MKAIGVGISEFKERIEQKFLYVDKTEFIWQLLRHGTGEYFLIRPHGFGKSLLISTLKAIFQGQRKLFKGMAIDNTDYDWKEYPVVHLDFSDCKANTPDSFCSYLDEMVQCESDAFGITPSGYNCVSRFANLIKTAAANGKVVVLVDNYDVPVSRNLGLASAHEIHRLLKDFLLPIKGCNEKIHFALLAGTQKIWLADSFGGLNNLTDITLNPEYAGMLGFSESEIRENFVDRIPLAAEANNCTAEELMRTLLKWYDGYRFSKAVTHVCNPVSVSKFFNEGYEFSNYWDDTGMPSFLLKIAREKAYDYEAALSEWYDKSVFSAYELDQLDVTGLLWQTGYLTIKEVRQGRRGLQYRLDFPDMEVMDTFSMRLLEYYGKVEKGGGGTLVDSFADAIVADDLEQFMTLFQSFLANISYDMHLPYEKYYQTIFFVVFKLLGASIDAESKTNEGRIDAYVRTKKKVYLFEFKLDKSAEKAISQIIHHHYYEKFQNCGLPIVMVGVNFDSSKGRIADWTTSNA